MKASANGIDSKDKISSIDNGQLQLRSSSREAMYEWCRLQRIAPPYRTVKGPGDVGVTALRRSEPKLVNFLFSLSKLPLLSS